jgi:hypothetical protein
MRISAGRSVAAVGVLAVAAALAGVVPSGADPVAGGKTVLKPDQDTFEALADMSIGVEATGAAKFGKNGAKFPISRGNIKKGPKGAIVHRGGLAFFTEGGPGLKLSKFFVKISEKKTKLFAKSGQAEVRFLDLDLSDATIGGSAGVNLTIKGAAATLAKPAAEVMTDVFDFPFKKGIPIGTINVKAQIG